jgi:hypothetical protein
MQKPLALSIAACLALTGCNAFRKSETWSQAVKVRPAETTLDPDPSNAYAAKLHNAFTAQGVEHKVVVFQYEYTTRHYEKAVGTRTAVIYRDDSNPAYPWWLKDDRLNNPFWLPNGSLDKQVSFYIRRKAQVIEVKEYPARGGSGKTSLTLAQPAPKIHAAHKPQAPAAVTRLAPVKKAPAPVVARKPAPETKIARSPETAKAPVKRTQPEPVAKGPVTAIKAVASIFTPKPAAAAKDLAAPEPIASRNTGGSFWAPPAVLDPEQQPALTAPRDTHMEKLFRAKHGTDYNRFSPTDRRKMQQLQHGLASRE